jgi:putative alpha-1,2-mannosidase
MCKYIILLLLVVTSVLFAADRRAVDYVNPFIGTDGHGHTYPGATVPFGMVQLSPDNGKSGWDWCSGYHYSDTAIVGFSHTHLSGTGCADLGDILFLPTVGSDALDSLPHSRFSHAQETAGPGYYSVVLETHGITAELTATERVGFHRYLFPKSDSAMVIVDLGYGNDDTPMETQVTIDGPTRISGSRISAGWAQRQYIYFAAEFSQAFDSRAFTKNGTLQSELDEVYGKTTKALLRFDMETSGKPLLVKVGISAVSVEGARRNLQREIPAWDFDAVRLAARDAWQQELQKIRIESADTANVETFYTALYHTMLAPTLFCDVDGSYRGGDGQVHHGDFQNSCTFSLWDTYRAAHPLYTIIEPGRVHDWAASMLAFYHDSGLLPVWPLTGNETWCMIGYHSVPVLADAYFKGLLGLDAEPVLEAMKTSAYQNRRGLQFYNMVTPQPIDVKLKELREGAIVVPDSLRRAAISGTSVLPGYAKSIAGEVIHYHSSYPYVNDALLVRTTDGKMKIEWQTAPVPTDIESDTVTFMWVAGLCTFRGGHRFDLYGNDELWLSFNSSTDTTHKFWSETSKSGVTLTFLPTYLDVYDDFFGEAYLKVPAKLLKKGEPLKLRVVGENGGSSDWYMTFEHQSRDTALAVPEYALAEANGQRIEFVRILVESLQSWRLQNIPVDGIAKSLIANTGFIRPGLTEFILPFPEATDSLSIDVGVKVLTDDNKTRDLATLSFDLSPITPYRYIPADKERESVSKTLEYAYDDWCIAQVAKALGKTEDAALFEERAGFYKNLFDSTTGFMRGKNSDRSWVTPFDPRFGTEKQPQYTEGNAWQYSWYVPQDVPGLIGLMGGNEAFCTKLDSLFNQSENTADIGAPPDVSGLIGMYAHGNEPSHHIAYLYDFAGQPWKTQATVRQIMHDFYTNKADGLCGNEDCGQMSAWYIFSALGFYPVNPADGKYEFGSPLFEKASVDVGNGKTFTVLAHHSSPRNVFVQSVKLNGAEYHQRHIAHREIMDGGTLEFDMGPRPNPQWVMHD